MKAFSLRHLIPFLLLSCFAVNARDAMRYKFSEDETNVFAVEISIRSETGTEVITGNVFVVTKSATTNSATLICRAAMKTENRRSPQRGMGFYPGHYPGSMNGFLPECEIVMDNRGNELRDGGDQVLAVPLGKLVQSLFEPLPAKSATEESTDAVFVLDEPLWLGPAENFMNARPNGSSYPMNYYMGGGQRNPVGTLLVSRHKIVRVKNSTDDTVHFHVRTKLESFLKTGNEPRLAATSESDYTFDPAAGLVTTIETQGDVVSQTESISRKAKIIFKAHLLEGEELAAALAPPPPPAPPRKLSNAEVEKILADLKSAELETRRSALRQLSGVEIETPSDELLDLAGALAFDSDMGVRMNAANFLGTYATTNQSAILLKLVKDSEWSVREPAIKSLVKFQDQRVIQPLADLLARGGNSMNGQQVSSALINFGAAAEPAVLKLLNERNTETQRAACNILQQTGTAKSLDALQKLVADNEQSLGQAAIEAIRNIKMRQ